MYIKKNILIHTFLSVRRLLPRHLKIHGFWVMISLFINSVFDLLGIAALFPLFTIILQDDILSNKYLKNIYETLGFQDSNFFFISICIAILVLVGIKNLIYVFSKRFQARFAYILYEHYTGKLMDITYNKGFDHLNNKNSNVVLRDISHVPRMYALLLVLPLLTLLNELIVVVIILGVLFFFYPMITLILLIILIPMIVLFYNSVKKHITFLEESLNELVPENTRYIFDILFGFQDIVMSNTFGYFRRKFKKTVKKERRYRSALAVYNELPTRVVEIGVMTAIVIILAYCYFYIDTVEERLSLLGIFGFAAFRLMPSFNKILTAVVRIKGQQYTFDTINECVKPQTRQSRKQKPISFQNHIKIDQLTYYYLDGEEKVNILKDFSFDINKGEFVGIVGPSGSGKSTLIRILLRFIHEKEGAIYVDDQKLEDAYDKAWRKLIGYVRQDVFIVDGTMKENICFGVTNVDEEKLKRSIKMAGLEQFVSQLKEKENTKIGERGDQVSGGQRQRIGIARALYNEPEILVLDESTASLDTKTEVEVLKTIKALSDQYNLTILLITHNQKNLQYCDKVIQIGTEDK